MAGDVVREGDHDVEGFHVLAAEIPHKGGRTFGYRVSDGAATLAYLSDHSPIGCGEGPDGLGAYHRGGHGPRPRASTSSSTTPSTRRTSSRP